MSTRLLRSIVRTVAAATAIALLCFAPRYPQAVRTLVGLSPFAAAAGMLAAGSAGAVVWWAVFPAAAAAIRKRFFCRWLCPTGRCLDLLGAAGTRCGLRAPRFPRAGWWIALATLGGACFGYPLLLWLDPLALLAAPLTAPRTTNLAAGSATLWYFLLPAAVVLIALAAPGLWCARLCPLGGFQEFLHWAVRPWRWSPVRLFRRRPATAGPATAQGEASENWGDDEGPGRTVGRRVVLAGAAGAVWGWALVRRGDSGSERPLRPPGAADERQFTGLCLRCGNCISACPEKILVASGASDGWVGLLAPQVRFDPGYCREDCVRCTQACPSGAIRPVKKRDKVRALIGFPRVDMNVCILGEDGECTACARACPFEAIRYEFCETDYTTVPRIDPDRCPGCGACQVACPTEPKSIVIVADHPRRSTGAAATNSHPRR